MFLKRLFSRFFYRDNMKVIVAGSRHFTDYDLVVKSFSELYQEGYLLKMRTIISGGARGADKLGERYAKQNNLKVIIYSAKWDEHGRAAGPIRNIEMANAADALVAFWDGVSRGTGHMIDAMRERGKEIHIIGIPPLDTSKYDQATLDELLK